MSQTVQQLVDFRESLHQFFPYRAGATMDLIDAIAGNSSAQSPVQLSLNSLFPRQYSSLHDAVDNFFVPTSPDKAETERRQQQLGRMRLVAGQWPKPQKRNFHLFGLDTTGQPRPFAPTLKDRGIHYQPNPAPGNRPIMVGHTYSVLAGLPEKAEKPSPPWVLPLLIRRVPTDKKAIDVGADQVADLLQDESLPFGSELSALVADSSYSAREFLGPVVVHKNLATIVRMRGNRVFYRKPVQDNTAAGRGHPIWYGASFDMKEASTWGEPDAVESVPFTFRNGRVCQVEIEAWHNLLMRGTKDIAMHKHPFTLIRITMKDSEGKAVFNRPLWLAILGERCYEITLFDAYKAYRQRYDLEHFFRFGKNRLLMASYQTPEVEHEENWWEIVGLAYVLLYGAAPLAQTLPRPWERYLAEVKENQSGQLPSPSMVQRDLDRIIQEIGTPSQLPKPRGKSPGRKKGYRPEKRERLPVVKKGSKRTSERARAP
jgi:hypothetical protein